MGDAISGIVSGVLTAAVVAAAAALWRWRLLRRYGLTAEARQVLEALWDENLLRRGSQIASELGVQERSVLTALDELQEKKLVRRRERPAGLFWKITSRGREYLSQRSWLD